MHLRLSIVLASLILALPTTAQVEWQPWNDATRQAAQERDQPIFLHLGDALNELAHAMTTQTFANREVAAFLNANFICVRADRDEVPELAAFGQQWLAADQKLAGWPLNLWFTPGLAPIEGASYLPPTEEWGREGFMVVAGRVAERWRTHAESVRHSAVNTQRLIADHLPFAAEPVDDLDAALARAADDWLALANPDHGTFGDAPHRPDPELLRFLIQRGGESRRTALAALRRRLAGALRDPVDGGFHRATADGAATIPVFQKRLADQARIALACLDAAAIDDDPVFAAGARSALAYTARLRTPNGTYRLGEDATAHAATQTWTWDELTGLVGHDRAAALGARPEGNVNPDEDLEGHLRGRNVLHASPLTTAADAWREALAKLQTARTERFNPPGLPVATAGAHGLLLHALDRAGRELPDFGAERAEELREVLKRDFGVGGDSFSRLADRAVDPTPEDFLLVALGFRDRSLVEVADARFYDAELGLYYATATPVFEVRPLWWQPTAGDLPAPAVWRALQGDAPSALVTELAAPFDNPDAPPGGEVLLALQATLASD